jgi:hypothetical protein
LRGHPLREVIPGPNAPVAPEIQARVQWLDMRLFDLTLAITQANDPEALQRCVLLLEAITIRRRSLAQGGTLEHRIQELEARLARARAAFARRLSPRHRAAPAALKEWRRRLAQAEAAFLAADQAALLDLAFEAELIHETAVTLLAGEPRAARHAAMDRLSRLRNEIRVRYRALSQERVQRVLQHRSVQEPDRRPGWRPIEAKRLRAVEEETPTVI